jgi:hypothetical protein
MRAERERQAWDRQPLEPSRAYHAFCHVRDLGDAKRSIFAAWLAHKTHCEHVAVAPGRRRAPARWEEWSTAWGWQDRSSAFDSDVRSQKDVALKAEQIETCKRHARAAQGAFTILTVPIRALLDRLQHPEFMAELAKMSALGLLREALKAIDGLPAVAAMEREALGIKDDGVPLDPPDMSFSNRIASNPEATRAAIELLDALAAAPEEKALRPEGCGVFGRVPQGKPS